MSPPIPAQVFDTLAGFVKARSGIELGADKLYLLESRLEPVLRAAGLKDLAALADRLRNGREEAIGREVVEAMTTNESLFFRDNKPFAHCREQVLPRLHAIRSPTCPLRIWSAAASTGQEAYSLAMIVTELRPRLGARRAEIVGTDIAREPLARAREGLYTQFEVQRGLPMHLLVKHFAKEGAGWRISPSLREMVQFREMNLLGDLQFLGRFDIVMCRNVLIYFDQPTKSRVLRAIARQMAPDGVLYLGGAETILGLGDSFAPLPGERGAYGLIATTSKAEPMPVSP
jgi:chemotaxis protein methyltransferase CheR